MEGLEKILERPYSFVDRFVKPLKTEFDEDGERAAMGHRVYDPKVDYSILLEKLKEDFERKWTQHNVSPETNLEKYEELAVLGAGSFGKVKLVKEKGTTHYYAAKMLVKDQIVKTKQVTHVHNEKRVLNSVNFPFLIHLEFSTKDNDSLYLGLPFINGGELFTYHRKVRKFNEKQARFYAAQVFLGLEYLHNVKLLYRDLKPENIMIDKSGYIKITDFGFAKKVETRTLTLCGTPEYLAPEIIQSKPYGVSVDWWSYGVLVYELVAGNSPFAIHNRDVMVMYAKICDGDFRMPSFFTVQLRDLIDHLLQVDMSKRFGSLINGSKDIKNHEWFRGVDWYALLNQEINPPYVPNVSNMEDLSNFDKFVDTKPKPKSKSNKHAEIFADF